MTVIRQHLFNQNNLTQIRQEYRRKAGSGGLAATQAGTPYLLNTDNTHNVLWYVEQTDDSGGSDHLPELWFHNDSYTSAPTSTDISGHSGIIRGKPPIAGAVNNKCMSVIMPYDPAETTTGDHTLRSHMYSRSNDGSDYFIIPWERTFMYSYRIMLPTFACPYTGRPMNRNDGTGSEFQISQIYGSGGTVQNPEVALRVHSDRNRLIIRTNFVLNTRNQEDFIIDGLGLAGDNKPLGRWLNLVYIYRMSATTGIFEAYASLDNDDVSTNKVADWFEVSGSRRTTHTPSESSYGPGMGFYRRNFFSEQPAGSRASGCTTLNLFVMTENESLTSPVVQPWMDVEEGDTDPPTKPVIVLSAGTPDTTAIDATESTSTDDTGVTDWRFYKQTTEMIHNPDLSVDDFAAGDGDKTTGWQRNAGTSLWTIDTGEGTLSVSGATTGGTWTEPDTGVAALSVGDKIEVQFDYAQSNGVGTLAAAMGGNPDYTTDPTNSSFVAAVQGTGSFRGVHEITDLTFYEFRFRPWDGWNGSVSNINLRKLVQDGADEAAGAHSYESLIEATLYRMNVQTLDAAENESVVSDTAELATVDSTPPVDPLTASPYSEDAVNKNSGATTHTPIADGVPAGGTAPYVILSVSPITGCSVSATSSVVTFTPNQTFSGNATYSITFGDSSGPQQTVTVTVTTAVTNHAPVAVPQTGDLKIYVGEDQTTQFLMGGFASDSDGDPLVYSAVTSAGSLGNFIVLSDKTTGQYVSTGGTGTDSTPEFKATDDSSVDSDDTAIHFEVVSPNAIRDLFTIERGETSYELDVLVNDQDPAGGGLTITSINSLGTTDIPVGNGLVSTDGSTLTYVPIDPTISGYVDTFTYTIEDSLTSTAIGTVEVVSIAEDDNPITAGSGTPVDITMSNPVTSGQVDVSALVESELGNVIQYSVQTQATYGTATIDNNGILTYTPGFNKLGTYRIVWSAVSDAGNTREGTEQFNVIPGTRLPR